MISSVGAAIDRMSSSGQAYSLPKNALIFSTSSGKSSGFGAWRRYASSYGVPAKKSGVNCWMPARSSGYSPS